jgi:hypothetical protein
MDSCETVILAVKIDGDKDYDDTPGGVSYFVAANQMLR